jgi:O-antigen ligase
MSQYAAEQAAKHAGVVESAPHNSWIEAGSETGITGVVLWWMLIVGSAWGVVRLRRDMPLEWSTGTPDQRFLYLATIYVPIAMLGFVVCATFVSFAWSDQSYALPAIALGMQKAFAEQMALGTVPAWQMPGPLPGTPAPKAKKRRVRRAYGHVVGMDGVHNVNETRSPKR